MPETGFGWRKNGIEIRESLCWTKINLPHALQGMEETVCNRME